VLCCRIGGRDQSVKASLACQDGETGMSIQPGSHELGPDNATLRVETGRRGAAAKAGHDLVIDVTTWGATVEVGDRPDQLTLHLRAEPGSLKVLEGTGGVRPLGEDDKEEIQRTIAEQVLSAEPIEFRSTDAEASEGGERLRISGELTMNGATRPLEFELSVDADGKVTGGATVRQSDWGIEPYSGLFGALKVKDEVHVLADAALPVL
jgi:YceI-like domain